jgi:hypothetical protein
MQKTLTFKLFVNNQDRYMKKDHVSKVWMLHNGEKIEG